MQEEVWLHHTVAEGSWVLISASAAKGRRSHVLLGQPDHPEQALGASALCTSWVDSFI